MICGLWINIIPVDQLFSKELFEAKVVDELVDGWLVIEIASEVMIIVVDEWDVAHNGCWPGCVFDYDLGLRLGFDYYLLDGELLEGLRGHTRYLLFIIFLSNYYSNTHHSKLAFTYHWDSSPLILVEFGWILVYLLQGHFEFHPCVLLHVGLDLKIVRILYLQSFAFADFNNFVNRHRQC